MEQVSEDDVTVMIEATWHETAVGKHSDLLD